MKLITLGNLETFKKKYPNEKIYPISSIYNEGIDVLIKDLNELVKTSASVVEEDMGSFKEYKFVSEKPFTIAKEDGIWVVKGEKVEQLFKMTRFTEDESVLRFAHKLKKIGVEEALTKAGAKIGDEVKILDYIFNFKE